MRTVPPQDREKKKRIYLRDTRKPDAMDLIAAQHEEWIVPENPGPFVLVENEFVIPKHAQSFLPTVVLTEFQSHHAHPGDTVPRGLKKSRSSIRAEGNGSLTSTHARRLRWCGFLG